MRAAVRSPDLITADLKVIEEAHAALVDEIRRDQTISTSRRGADDGAAMRRTKVASLAAGIAALQREADLAIVGGVLSHHPRVRRVAWVQDWDASDRAFVRPCGMHLHLELDDGAEHRIAICSIAPQALADALLGLLGAG